MSNDKKDIYQQYLEDKHAKFGVERAIVEGIIEKATGDKSEEVERVIAGEVNEVYDVTTQGGNYIIRISRGQGTRFLVEKWALDKSREAGVPAPNMFFVDELEDSGQSLKICVEGKLPGTPWNEIKKTKDPTDEEKREIVLQAGELLAKIHSVVPQKFGDLSEGGIGRYDTWEEYMTTPPHHDEVEQLYKYAEQVDLTKQDVDRVIEILRQHTDIYRQITPHLIHGDYGPKHWLVQNGRITGVIDFENCKSGDPMYDFGWKSFFGSEIMIEGYERVTSLPDNFELRKMLCTLRVGFDMVWYYPEQNHPTGIVHTTGKMKELLAYFDKNK